MNPIYLKLSKPFETLPATASRFWGNPALPEDMDWPCYVDKDGEVLDYVFVCQINLKDVAPYDTDNLLPSKVFSCSSPRLTIASGILNTKA